MIFEFCEYMKFVLDLVVLILYYKNIMSEVFRIEIVKLLFIIEYLNMLKKFIYRL